MNRGFWQKLNRPIMCLAPMYHVTDVAFREVIAENGKPDIFFTEFVSVDGLCSEGKERLLHLLKYTEKQRPIVAQIWGIFPENFEKAAEMMVDMGYDGIDINFGCPDKAVVKKFGGCGVINNPDLATLIIEATKRGAGDLPVSVKTRVGYNKDITEEWTEHILKSDPVALTLHARTKKEMSKVPAHWDSIKRAVDVRDNMNSDTLIIGNGDVKDLDEAHKMVEEYGCDGVMIGRGIFGNPWRFNRDIKKEDLRLSEILKVLDRHTRLFEEWLGKDRNFDIMKKHFASYIKGFPNTKDLKISLMECKNANEVSNILNKYIK